MLPLHLPLLLEGLGAADAVVVAAAVVADVLTLNTNVFTRNHLAPVTQIKALQPELRMPMAGHCLDLFMEKFRRGN